MKGTIGFDGPAPPGTVNLGLGQPSADLLPLERIRRVSDVYFREAHPRELNYGDLPGDAGLLDSLAGYLSDGYGAMANANALFVTGRGAQVLRQRLLATGLINSGGGINRYTSHIVRLAIDLGLLDEHVASLRRAYRSRVSAMDAALDTGFQPGTVFSSTGSLQNSMRLSFAPMMRKTFSTASLVCDRLLSDCRGRLPQLD